MSRIHVIHMMLGGRTTADTTNNATINININILSFIRTKVQVVQDVGSGSSLPSAAYTYIHIVAQDHTATIASLGHDSY